MRNTTRTADRFEAIDDEVLDQINGGCGSWGGGGYGYGYGGDCGGYGGCGNGYGNYGRSYGGGYGNPYSGHQGWGAPDTNIGFDDLLGQLQGLDLGGGAAQPDVQPDQGGDQTPTPQGDAFVFPDLDAGSADDGALDGRLNGPGAGMGAGGAGVPAEEPLVR